MKGRIQEEEEGIKGRLPSAPVVDNRNWTKGQWLCMISDGMELLRAEISKVRIGGISSPELRTMRSPQRFVGIVGSSGIGGFFHPFSYIRPTG